jgi:short-subunit dehydrogenase
MYFNLYLSVSLVEPGPVATEFSSAVASKGIDGLESGDEETKGLINKVIEALKSKQNTQTGEDVAKCVLKAIEDEKPHLHYITSKLYEEHTKKKYVDITGDSLVQLSTQRFFPPPAK